MRSGISRSAVNLVRICVMRWRGAEFQGEFYHRYSEQPICFVNPADMVQKMDTLYDELGYPQRTVQPRSFSASAPEPKRREPVVARKAVNDLETQQGELATFVVHVMYRQNATWQGNVLWAEADKSCNFRSALELIKLMDSALDEGGRPKEDAGEISAG